MRHSKTRLSIGKKCKKTLLKRSKCQVHLCYVKSVIVESCLSVRRPYSPRNPVTKTFTSPFNSPIRLKTPKHKKILKRMSSNHKQENILQQRHDEITTPSKSPSAKKARRSLYLLNKKSTPMREESIFKVSKVCENTESMNLFCTNSSEFACFSSFADTDPASQCFSSDEATVLNVQDKLDNNLNDDCAEQTDIATMIDLIPAVMQNLSVDGCDQQMLNFFKLVSSSQFPLKNVAFQLWLDVVQWFSCSSSTEMRYSENSKKFWKLGYRLFGGQFLHFMSGFKNRNTVVMDETVRGLYPTSQSEINFAVPSKNILISFSPYGEDDFCAGVGRQPGLLRDMISTLAKSPAENSYCLTFDGKKLKRGLTKTSGDVNLFGFESGLSLANKQKQNEQLKKPVEQLMQMYSTKDETQDISNNLRELERKELTDVLSDNMKTVSLNILEARDLRKKKQYTIEKLKERSGGQDWKNGKFVMAISSIIAFVHDIDEFLRDSISLVEELNICISYLKKSHGVITGDIMNLEQCEYYRKIQVPENTLPTNRQIKQRSPEWFESRSKARVTGSTIYAALGLDGLAKQKEHFDVTIGGLAGKEKSERVNAAMAHGTNNEINAVATLVGKILPVMCPGQNFYEEGFVEIESKTTKSFMIVSPDGSIRPNNKFDSTTFAVELKCPVNDIQRYFPQRYLLQCLSEIEALDVDGLIYLCWRPDISTIFKINRNSSLFKKAFALAESIYDSDNIKRPTRLLAETKELKEEIHNVCNGSDTVEFITVVPSMTNSDNCRNTYSKSQFLFRRLDLLLNQLKIHYDKYYDLQRTPATEAVVFLCCDLDRKWEKETVHSAPVCWFPKGSSLDTSTMRSIVEFVLNTCKHAGLHIPAVSFDGQWHNIAVRDVHDKPLTMLQLQKDIWKRVEQMSKSNILKNIGELNKIVKHELQTSVCENESTKTSILCTNGGINLPKISDSVALQRIRVNRISEITNIEQDEEEEQTEGRHTVLEDTNHNDDTDKIDDASCDVYKYTNDKTADVQFSKHDSRPSLTLTDNDMISLLTQLRVDKNANAKGQWDEKSIQDISMCFDSDQTLRKLRDVDLRVVVRYLNRTYKSKTKESVRKESKIQFICELMNAHYSANEKESNRKHKSTKEPRRLSELAFKAMTSSLKKCDLNIIYAEYLWPDVHKKWRAEHVSPLTEIHKQSQFYFPAYSDSRKQFEVSCVDSSHLLTRMRRKSAKGGLDGIGNDAWRKVAKSKKTALSLAMVDCILEPMSVPVANTHFSKPVENEMRANNCFAEADLCRDIRSWWRAEDEPGISAERRLSLRSSLRRRLMDSVDLSTFPPPGMYVNGWPTQLWEAIIASIDAKVLLFNLTPKHTYNVRAFSSMMGETFFSELTLYDRRGHGTLTSAEFGQYIDITVEKLHMRLDPKRHFLYSTSNRKAYKLVGQYNTTDISEMQKDDENDRNNESPSKHCIIRDHEFDNSGRVRIKTKVKEAKIEPDRNAVSRGALGVRWETARRNESKLLPTFRLGLDFNEI